MNNKDIKIVVVGGGHAGVEAALAISRMGKRCYLITMDTDSIGRMSCNPAIGGLAKGHLVREIDALGGIMGEAADLTSIQFKTLNKSKGRAVWSPRAQVDKIKSDFLINERQYQILNNCNKQLKLILDSLKSNIQRDILADLLHSLLSEYNDVINPVNREDIINTIFSGFCVGK